MNIPQADHRNSDHSRLENADQEKQIKAFFENVGNLTISQKFKICEDTLHPLYNSMDMNTIAKHGWVQFNS